MFNMSKVGGIFDARSNKKKKEDLSDRYAKLVGYSQLVRNTVGFKALNEILDGMESEAKIKLKKETSAEAKAVHFNTMEVIDEIRARIAKRVIEFDSIDDKLETLIHKENES